MAARDPALILLYASALRPNELSALDAADITPPTGGVLLTVCRSKTDQDGSGEVVGVAHGRDPDTDPVTALVQWTSCGGPAARAATITNLRAVVSSSRR